ncbi:DNA polymerase III subunit gamma/tau [Pseudothermotoga thermarum]|uniref:DNA polymerase III subunit gamma/tau n=1 Tax=Pseudothermotoga thermarum TaxID=119394 RepID=UPI00059CFF00|nr:DNA polymerase III subunit gamma/tau [Pseudothermotoga thermarum]
MEALYRKYRPKCFNQIIDQEQAKLVLQNAIKKNKVSHAYIFAGPRGTGKTSIARILAKALNCPNRVDYEPCCKCDSCLAIDKGIHPDVIELDAASNRGIDEIRRIRDAVGFRPMMGNYKVYIVDEFHMLTREAFNALLKTLEEPPEKVVFVLATTNLERVPPTIISRCQVIQFKNLSEKNMLQHIKNVAQNEQMSIDEEAALIIVKRASGSLRDALSMLEQVSSYAQDGKIDVSVVEKALGLVPTKAVEDYIEAILKGDIVGLVKLIDEVYDHGYDVDQLVQMSLEFLEKKISENPSKEYIDLARKIFDISKDLRYAENKRLILKLLSTNLAQQYRKTEAQPAVVESKPKTSLSENSNVQPQQPTQPQQIQAPESVTKEEKGSGEIEKVLEYLKTVGDIALFVALSQAQIKVKEKEIEISFLPTQKFQYEYVKQKTFELEFLLKSLLKKDFTIKLVIDEAREKEILKKLRQMFPGKVQIEE